MLNRFKPNNRILTKTIVPINPVHLDNTNITGSLLSIPKPNTTKFQSHTKVNENKVVSVINPIHLDNTNITGSLLNIAIPNTTKFEAQTKSNENTNVIKNNKNVISKSNSDILEYSAKYIESGLTRVDINQNQLIIDGIMLDYGTEQPSIDNFEIVVGGLYLPDIYNIYQSGSSVVIQLNENFIDYTDFSISDVMVYGKLLNIGLDTENGFDIDTELGENIII
jgi:hypothetical protein